MLSTIQGNAVNSTNGALADTVVRLRDARSAASSRPTTDNAGLFAFQAVDPGSYIVEMMGASNDVVLASIARS